MDWLPIATAPKTSTILVYGKMPSGSYGATVAAWRKGRWRTIFGTSFAPHDEDPLFYHQPTLWSKLQLPSPAQVLTSIDIEARIK